jgi:hypothetical protein
MAVAPDIQVNVHLRYIIDYAEEEPDMAIHLCPTLMCALSGHQPLRFERFVWLEDNNDGELYRADPGKAEEDIRADEREKMIHKIAHDSAWSDDCARCAAEKKESAT